MEPTFPQALHYLSVCVRLRNAQSAVYWYLYAAKLATDPNQRMLLCRRVLLAAGEDCFCVPVQLEVSRWFHASLGREMKDWLTEGVAKIHIICATDTWWNHPTLASYVLQKAQANARYEQQTPLHQKLLAHNGYYIPDKYDALLTHWAMHLNDDYTARGGDRVAYAQQLVDSARLSGLPAARMSAVIHTRAGKVLSYFDGFISQAFYRLHFGPLGLQQYPNVHRTAVLDSIKHAKLRDQPPTPPPDYSTLPSQVACIRSFLEFGSLNLHEPYPENFYDLGAAVARLGTP